MNEQIDQEKEVEEGEKAEIKEKEMQLKEAVEKLKTELKLKGSSGLTIKNYSWFIEKFVNASAHEKAVNQLSEEDVKTLQEAIDEAKTHLEATDKEELEKAAKDLSEKIMPIGAKMYESANADSETSNQQSGTSEDEDKTKKKPGKGKDEPVEGEVVDEDTSPSSEPDGKKDKEE